MLEKQERRAAYEAMEKQKKLIAEEAERKIKGKKILNTLQAKSKIVFCKSFVNKHASCMRSDQWRSQPNDAVLLR